VMASFSSQYGVPLLYGIFTRFMNEMEMATPRAKQMPRRRS
jgi:hypothetical protein